MKLMNGINSIYLFGNVRIKAPITKGITIQGAVVLCGIVLWWDGIRSGICYTKHRRIVENLLWPRFDGVHTWWLRTKSSQTAAWSAIALTITNTVESFTYYVILIDYNAPSLSLVLRKLFQLEHLQRKINCSVFFLAQGIQITHNFTFLID